MLQSISSVIATWMTASRSVKVCFFSRKQRNRSPKVSVLYGVDNGIRCRRISCGKYVIRSGRDTTRSATAHRTLAFKWFESHSHKIKRKDTGWYPFFLWQMYHKMIQCTATRLDAPSYFRQSRKYLPDFLSCNLFVAVHKVKLSADQHIFYGKCG